MMSGSKSLALLMCLLLGAHAGSHGQSPPTASPSVAPTSAPTSPTPDEEKPKPDSKPTSMPTSSPTSAPGTKPDGGEVKETTTQKADGGGDVVDGGATTTGAADPNATTTAAQTVVTTFDSTMALSKASDFSPEAYMKGVAAAAGVEAGAVTIEFSFEVKVTYSFTEAITEAECKGGAAAMANASADDVSCVLTEVRRLRGADGRRLQTTTSAAVTIKVKEADAADDISAAAADPALLVAGIKEATGKTVAAPTVTEAPAMSVKVTTSVTATAAVPAADKAFTDAVTATMAAETGKTLTVAVDNVESVTVTTPPTGNTTAAATTTAGAGDEERSAGMQSRVASSTLLFAALCFSVLSAN